MVIYYNMGICCSKVRDKHVSIKDDNTIGISRKKSETTKFDGKKQFDKISYFNMKEIVEKNKYIKQMENIDDVSKTIENVKNTDWNRRHFIPIESSHPSAPPLGTLYSYIPLETRKSISKAKPIVLS